MTALLFPGQGSSLGKICAGDVEIKSFGPQSLPLTDDLKQFGIRAVPIEGWACCLGMPEVWLEVKAHTTESECKLDIRFVGLKPEVPLAFVFYAKAPSCTTENDTLKPKSLHRYHGESQKVTFHPSLTIEAAQMHKLQVIPLAGDDSFWNAEFLVAFEIHPFAPQPSFLIKKI